MSMTLASQPIAVAPPNKQDNDLIHGVVSFSPRSSLFAGSPMSFKMGSLQNRFYPGASPGQSLGPIAIPDLKRSMSGSYDRPDPAIFYNSLCQHGDIFIPEEDLCKNYTCCGKALPDLHALVDHFESTHVLVDETESYVPPALQAFASYTTTHVTPPASVSDNSPPAFEADDMDISEPSPSPPPTPASTGAPNHLAISAQSAFDQIRVGPFFRPQHQSSYSSLTGANGPGPSAFNRYAGYSDYSSNLPGTDPSPTYNIGGLPQKDGGNSGSNNNICMSTALLFSSSAEPTPLNTPVSSRTGSPEYHHRRQQGYRTHSAPNGTLPLHPASSDSSSPTSFRVPPSSQRSAASVDGASSSSAAAPVAKPFRCPKSGCNKSYKQQNGLKYHLSHGQCNFAPRDPEVDRLTEAERDKRLRPFVCKVGTECNRRYKNMNGLRYHYTHTGEHGQIGLDMLSRGVHPLPDSPNGTGVVRSKSAGSSAASTPMGTPTPTQAEFPQTSYFPATAMATAPMQGSSTSLQMVQGAQQPSQSQMHQFWVKEEGGMVI